MANVKGVQLKAIKKGIGHDLAGFQANIYLNNKKIGTVVDNGYGGGLEFYFDKEEDTFDNVASFYHKEISRELPSKQEELVYGLLHLSEMEKDFKKAVKRGYSFIALFDYYPRDKNGNRVYDKPVPYPAEEVYFIPNEEEFQKAIAEKKPVKHEVYRTLEDFIIE